MIEIKNKDKIKKEMLDNLSNEYEKSEGFLTHDLVSSGAIQISKLYDAIQNIILKIDVNNLQGDELSKYVKQRRGIIRTSSTKAKVILTVLGDGDVHKGDMFSTSNNIIFLSLEDKEIKGETEVLAECSISGSIGMVGSGSITQFPITLSGLIAVKNKYPSYEGYDEQDDESLITRYYEDLQNPATSGNVNHYKQWANEVVGVGKAKVFPCFYGKNTVKILIINDDMLPPDDELIESVQRYIDPKNMDGKDTWGSGYGQAPIGAKCTVEGATNKDITISLKITSKISGYSVEDIKNNIEKNIKKYFRSIAFDDTHNFASYAVIGSLILNTEGVEDYEDLLINGNAVNISVGDSEVFNIDTIILL